MSRGRIAAAGSALLCLVIGTLAAEPAAAACVRQARFAVVVHGGEISKQTPEDGRLDAMRAALAAARTQLANGASSLDVVETIVRGFEDSGRFNAGRGAIADAGGVVETDASIMDGRTLS